MHTPNWNMPADIRIEQAVLNNQVDIVVQANYTRSFAYKKQDIKFWGLSGLSRLSDHTDVAIWRLKHRKPLNHVPDQHY